MTDIFTQKENMLPFSRNKDVFQKALTPGENTPLPFQYSLSVVLPAYNEEQVISSTITDVLTILSGRISDFKVIVFNDGSDECLSFHHKIILRFYSKVSIKKGSNLL